VTQTWSPDVYQRNASFVPALGQELIGWLNPTSGERILDLGCGDGTLTEQIRASGAQVTGVDSSKEMAAAARARGLDVFVMDGEALTFDGEFDAVFSNAAMHWMHGADAVAAGVHRALVPGGRFVGEFGGHACIAAIHTAVRAVLKSRGIELVTPWYFPTAEQHRVVLERHGFDVDRAILFPRPTPLPTGIRGWFDTFAGPLFGSLSGTARQDAIDEAESLLRPVLCDDQGRWTADYTRVRFSARKRSGELLPVRDPAAAL
jgi:SAM-dependent methyltransferase